MINLTLTNNVKNHQILKIRVKVQLEHLLLDVNVVGFMFH